MKTLVRILLICLILALTGCGGGVVRGQPPLVGISTLNLDDQQIRARLDLHNPNGVEMQVDTIEMSMELGDAHLGRHSTRPGLEVHPNGTEEIGMDFPGDEGARNALQKLERGEVNSLPYSVSGVVRDGSGGAEEFSQKGYLYPVPGRPGSFRGAGPQRERPSDR